MILEQDICPFLIMAIANLVIPIQGKKTRNGFMGDLSALGKEVVKEMNRLGMMIDISHPSKEATKDMIELSKAPIIASHSSARAIM